VADGQSNLEIANDGGWHIKMIICVFDEKDAEMWPGSVKFLSTPGPGGDLKEAFLFCSLTKS
jgi:hypothetical protein